MVHMDLDVADRLARVLIVDDEALNRQLLKAMLEPEGYLLMSAASGEEALALIARQPPDLILLDIKMPGLDGCQMAARITGNPATKHIPIIMVTALDDRDTMMIGLRAGAENFLTKPVDRAELCIRVKNVLRVLVTRPPTQVRPEIDSSVDITELGTVAIFEASEDTVNMMQGLLTEAHAEQSLMRCPFADLKRGITDFRKYLDQHNPEVVIIDISPPYDENWAFFTIMRDAAAMKGRGIVLTTTSKRRLDEVIGEDSYAVEVDGTVPARALMLEEIKAATRLARTDRRQAIDSARFGAESSE
jgi:CheY-like chemotaxis protein